MSNECWHLSLRMILIVGVCSYLLACGSTNNRSSIDSPAASVSLTKNPLVAKYVVSSQKGGTARVEFGTDTSYGRQTAWYSVPPDGTGIVILVAGMKASTTYHMRAEVLSGGASWFDKDRLFTTGPLPSTGFPTLVITRPRGAALVDAEKSWS